MKVFYRSYPPPLISPFHGVGFTLRPVSLLAGSGAGGRQWREVISVMFDHYK